MATAQKKPIVEYEVYLDWGDRVVFRAEKGSIFICNGEWLAIPSASFAANKPVYVPRNKVKYIMVNPS